MAFLEALQSFYRWLFEKDREFMLCRTRSTIADPKYLLRRSKGMIVRTFAKQYAKGRLIDLGCGMASFKGLFEGYVSDYIRFDYPATKASMGYTEATMDVAGDVRAIPLRAGSIDSVLLLDVLEHVFEVDAVVEGVLRVLEPGGTPLITTPFIYPLHGKPYDYHRFSFYALENYLSVHGLRVLERSVMGSYGTVLATLFNLLIMRTFFVHRGLVHLLGLVLRPLLLLAIVALNGLGRLLDALADRRPLWVYLENVVICEKVPVPKE